MLFSAFAVILSESKSGAWGADEEKKHLANTATILPSRFIRGGRNRSETVEVDIVVRKSHCHLQKTL